MYHLYIHCMHEDDRLTTIVVGKGEHKIDGDPVHVVSKEEIVVLGGISFESSIHRFGIQGGYKSKCGLQNMTIRDAKQHGVIAGSLITMKDVIVEQCECTGVVAVSINFFGKCTNVQVRQCGNWGLFGCPELQPNQLARRDTFKATFGTPW